ncbi:MAG: TIM barrel protein, partial [Pseudomonadota bacterium]
RIPAMYEKTFDEFDKLLGLKKLSLIHINDSKHELGSRRDRHEHIGKGMLGIFPFSAIVNDPRFELIPKILETPKGEGMPDYDEINLETMRELWAKKVTDHGA